MNKVLLFLLIAGVIFLLECTPFLYKNSYSIDSVDWTKVIAIPLGIVIWTYFSEKKSKKKS